MANPIVNNSPSGVIIWLEEFVRNLENQASQEVLQANLAGLSPDDVQLRLLFLAQMVATNTTSDERKQWAITLITHLAVHDGVDLEDPEA